MKLKEAQDRAFELLCLIDDICRNEGVRYDLDGGTEIAAVREKDIIPWDDDVDIKMLWSEYPKFKASLQKHLPDYIILAEPEAFSPFFYDFIVRVVDTRYLRRKVTEEDKAYHNLNNYLCVDVFLHFHVPAGSFSRFLAKARVKVLYGLGLGHRYHLDYSKYSGLQCIVVFLLQLIGRMIPSGFICSRFSRLAAHYDQKHSDSPWLFSNWVLSPCFQKSAWFDNTINGELRGRDFPVPADYDEELRLLYGDYLNPPEDRNAYTQHLDEEDRYKEPIA